MCSWRSNHRLGLWQTDLLPAVSSAAALLPAALPPPRYDARFVDSNVLRIAARSENQLQAGVQLVANRQAVVLEGAKVFPAAEGRYGEAHTMRCAALPECVLQVVSGISRECIG